MASSKIVKSKSDFVVDKLIISKGPDPALPFDWEFLVHSYLSGDVDNEYIRRCIFKLAFIVINKHFGYYSLSFKEELTSEAVVKGYQLLQADHFSPFHPVKPFLYAGMRNSCMNFIAKNCKEVNMPEDMIEFEPPVTDSKVWESTVLNFSILEQLFDLLDPIYGEYIPFVAERLEFMGFKLQSFPREVLGKIDSDPFVFDRLSRDIRDKIVCLAVWSKVEQTI